MQVTWVRGGKERDEILDFEDLDDLTEEMDAEVGFEDEDAFADSAIEGSGETVYVYLDEDDRIQWSLSRKSVTKKLQQYGDDEEGEDELDFTE